MRVVIDVADKDAALRDARHDGMNAWFVRRAPDGRSEIALDGRPEVVDSWLRKHGYGEGEYHVVFD